MGEAELEGIAAREPVAREHVNLRLTSRWSGHRSLRSRLRPTCAGAANPKPRWHRTAPHCGGAAQLEPLMSSTGDISIHPPLKGEWKFLRPPGHHPYAFDFVQLDDNRVSSHSEVTLQFFVNKISSDKFYCWSKPVYAPIDGTVIRVGNGWQDHEYTNIWKTIQIWYNATYRFRPKEENGRSPFPRFFVFQEVSLMLPVFLSAER